MCVMNAIQLNVPKPNQDKNTRTTPMFYITRPLWRESIAGWSVSLESASYVESVFILWLRHGMLDVSRWFTRGKLLSQNEIELIFV